MQSETPIKQNAASSRENLVVANPNHEAVANVKNPNKLRRFISKAMLGLIVLSGCSIEKPVDINHSDHEISLSTSTTTLSPELPITSTTEASKTSSLEIRGDQECLTDTQATLALLEAKSPASLELVQENIDIIECVLEGSGMFANEERPRFVVGDTTRESGTIRYASAIVHDAKHSALYKEYKVTNPGQPVPHDAWTGANAEDACLTAQAQALTDIGAPAYMLDYIVTVGDLEYWNEDYAEREW